MLFANNKKNSNDFTIYDPPHEIYVLIKHMCGSRMFCQRESNFDAFFLVDDGREDPNTTIGGPSASQCADDGPILNAGLVAL